MDVDPRCTGLLTALSSIYLTRSSPIPLFFDDYMAGEATDNASLCLFVIHKLPTGLMTFISTSDDTLEAPQPYPNPRAYIEFYKMFKREADGYDNDFINKHHD